jgi:hypothetical protein
VAPDVLGDSEVDEGEPLGSAALDLVERVLPRLDVDLGRRRRRHDEAPGQDAHTARVAGVERPVGVEVADVMGGVARRGEAVEAEYAVPDGVDVLLWHRRQLAPERVERVAVEPARALLQPGRVDEVRCADRRYVHLQRRVLAHEGPGRAGVVEVDVAEQQVPDVGQRETAVGEARLQRVDRRRGAAVEERRPVVGVEQVARDDPLAAEVVEVDRLRGHREDPKRRRSSHGDDVPLRAPLYACRMWWGIGGGLAILWLVLLIVLGLSCLRKGHWVMFILGIFLPLFWIIGAIIPPVRPQTI